MARLRYYEFSFALIQKADIQDFKNIYLRADIQRCGVVYIEAFRKGCVRLLSNCGTSVKEHSVRVCLFLNVLNVKLMVWLIFV